jgi:hypothetical protein
MPRVLGDRGIVIDYRHLIHSLIRKPAAFENYKYRDELYPTDNFKLAYDDLIKKKSNRQATLEYLRILKLSAENFEDDVDVAIDLILSDNDLILSSELIAELVLAEKESIIDSIELTPNLNIYDSLFLNKGDEDHENCYQ